MGYAYKSKIEEKKKLKGSTKGTSIRTCVDNLMFDCLFFKLTVHENNCNN